MCRRDAIRSFGVERDARQTAADRGPSRTPRLGVARDRPRRPPRRRLGAREPRAVSGPHPNLGRRPAIFDHAPEYFAAALSTGLFMVSAFGFAPPLAYPGSP